MRTLPPPSLLAAASALCLLMAAPPASAEPVVITFEGLTAMVNSPGSPVPAVARLSDAYLASDGVRFSSAGGFVAVVRLGTNHATSGVNAVGFSTASGLLTYDRSSPFTATFFDPADPSAPAVTDFVSVRGDMQGSQMQPITLEAFGLDGALLTSVTVPNAPGGPLLALSAPGIHSVRFLGTEDADGVGLDDFTFNPVTTATAPEPSTLLLLGPGLALLWPLAWRGRGTRGLSRGE